LKETDPGTRVNAGCIGGKLIEIHHRKNADFDSSTRIYRSVWDDEPHDPTKPPLDFLQWRDDPDGRRIGAWVG